MTKKDIAENNIKQIEGLVLLKDLDNSFIIELNMLQR